MIICYCEKCGDVIPQRQFDRGETAYQDQAHYCKACSAALGLPTAPVEGLNGASRASAPALRSVPEGSSGTRKSGSSGSLPTTDAGRPGSGPGSAPTGASRRVARSAPAQPATVRTAAPTDSRRSSRPRTPAAPERGSVPPAAWAAIGAAVLVVVLLFSGALGGPSEPTTPDPAPRTKPAVKPPGPRADPLTALRAELDSLEQALRPGEPVPEGLEARLTALLGQTEGTPLAERCEALAKRVRAGREADGQREFDALQQRANALAAHFQFVQAESMWDDLPESLRKPHWIARVDERRSELAGLRAKALENFTRGEIPDGEIRGVELFTGHDVSAWRTSNGGPAPVVENGVMVLRGADKPYGVMAIDGTRMFRDLHLSFLFRARRGGLRVAVRARSPQEMQAGMAPLSCGLGFTEAWEAQYFWRMHMVVRENKGQVWVEDRMRVQEVDPVVAPEGAILFLIHPTDELELRDVVVRVLVEGQEVNRGPDPPK